MGVTPEAIKERARALGFDRCGIAPATAFPELAPFREWLRRGYAGDMGYLPRTVRIREDVRRILPSARSVIVTATVYNTDLPYSTERSDPDEALVSRYAWGDDYHALVGRRQDELLEWLRQESGEPFEARAYVDTGPVHERVVAQHAGIGWIGKNGCLIDPELGSWLFLSEIICSLPLEPDRPSFDQCGSCSLCLEACPTAAFVAPRVLDARRCLSYLTIELRRAVPPAFHEAMGRHVFGCDICQDVCPWNQSAAVSDDPAWRPRPEFDRPRLLDLARLPEAELDALLAGTAMTRAGARRLHRNLGIALGGRRTGPRRSEAKLR